MEIERFVWTEHARMRLAERGLDAANVEQAIRSGHAGGKSTMDAPSGLSQGCCLTERRLRPSMTTLTTTMRLPFGSFPPGGWIPSRWAALPIENDVCLLRPRRRHRLVPDRGVERCRQRACSRRPAGLRPDQPPARRNRGLGCQHAPARQHRRSVARAVCRPGRRCLSLVHGRNWARTSDLQLVELALSQLSYTPGRRESSSGKEIAGRWLKVPLQAPMQPVQLTRPCGV